MEYFLEIYVVCFNLESQWPSDYGILSGNICSVFYLGESLATSCVPGQYGVVCSTRDLLIPGSTGESYQPWIMS